MAVISQIYETYHVPLHLQHHMYQVAAFGLWLCDNMGSAIVADKNFITTVNLLHDLGNLIKFDFRPGKVVGFKENEIDYWKGIQESLIQRYGTDENAATVRMAEEIGVSKKVIEILSQSGIEKIRYALTCEDWNLKIIRICDERISPTGVVTVEERYADLIARYANRDHKFADSHLMLERKEVVLKLEDQIQQHTAYNLQKVNTSMIEPYIAQLKQFEI